MKRVKVKKLYKGFASVRDYIIKDCLKKETGIIIEYGNKYMTVPYEKLKSALQLHRKKFESKFSDRKYELIDFKFYPDLEKQQELF